ncbi:MAG: Nif3-like dinuclear metal center hexameric protein [Clostridiales bacterium]|nr:Nif3-like dinuclear metal center hexameric protein [Clostridiales bacterium]
MTKKLYRVCDVIRAMEEIAPAELAEQWDHVGLMIGDSSSEVTGIQLALDANSAAINAAVENKANMIITHHPLFFSPLHQIDYETPHGANIRKIIKNDITLFAAHTNLDKAKTGVNQALAQELGLVMPIILAGAEVGLCGSVGQNSMTLFGFADLVKEKLGASGVILNTDKDKEVSRIFVQGGAFDEESIPILKLYRVDVVVTGEMKHHHMLDLEDAGIAVIVAGHEVTERIVLPSLKDQLLRKLPKMPIYTFDGHKWS